MDDYKRLETRIDDLETSMVTAQLVIQNNRHEIAALRAMLCALIDSFRPEEATKADEWLDAMQYVATQNAGLTIDLESDAIIQDRGVDSEMLAAMEDDRKAITNLLESLFAALKRPQGGLTRD